MAPEKIGRYQILSKLGQGGMASVYLAHDPRFGRDVAIKVLPAYFEHEADFAARFEREAKTLASLEHTAIVPVYDYGKENSPYLVMRFMKGGTLKKKLADGPLPAAEVIAIMERIGDALDQAHARGIIHRDLKPDNVLFDEYNRAYLSDFGIVKLADSSTGFTKTGNIVGTPAYMSPEQASGLKDITSRSDLYTLGVILYEMLTGHAPYNADTPVGLILKHVSEPIPPVLENNPELPTGCEVVISRAMAKDPDDRYTSAAEMISDLKDAFSGTLILRENERTLVDAPAIGAATAATLANNPDETPTTTAETPSPPPPPSNTAQSTAPGAPRQPEPAVVPAQQDSSGGSRLPLIIGGLVVIGLILSGLGYFAFARGNDGDKNDPAEIAAAETATAEAGLIVLIATDTPEPEIDEAATAEAIASATEEAILELTANAPTPTPTNTPTPAPTPLGGGGGIIAFDSNRDEMVPPEGEPIRRDIYLTSSDGFRVERLPGDVESDGDPAWSPDGTQIVFESRRDGNPELYVMNADGSNPIRLTDNEANDWAPAWSPDGSKIVFASTRTGIGEVYTINPDGTELTQITNLLTSDATFPTWSPDGTQIAFEALVRARVREIFVMNADGSNLTQITDTGAVNRNVDWSPDGSRLVFASNRDGNLEIYTMNVDGSDVVRVTTNEGIDWHPAWSPDGTKIAFVSQQDGNNEIYVANVDGSEAVNITNHPGEDQYPAWQPLPEMP